MPSPNPDRPAIDAMISSLKIIADVGDERVDKLASREATIATLTADLSRVTTDRDIQLKLVKQLTAENEALRAASARQPNVPPAHAEEPGPVTRSRTPQPPKLVPISNPLVFASPVQGNVDGRGGIYRGTLAIQGGSLSNAQILTTSNSGVEMDGGTLTDCVFLPGSKAGITARGKSPTISRIVIPDVAQYPIMFEGADEFVFGDVELRDTQWQSNVRWSHSSGQFIRVRVRADGTYTDADPKTPDVAAANRATGRGDTIGKGVRYIDSDIEAPTATHGAGNPLGGGSDSGDGAQGIGIKQFRLDKGWWFGANAAECLKAAGTAMRGGAETDRRNIIRACMAVAKDDKGNKYPGGSDSDVANTLSERDTAMRSSGLATHTNTRLVVNGLGTECNGNMRFDESCELTVSTLLREIHTAYPLAPWKMPNDLTRSAPSIILTGTKVTAKNGLGCTDAEAAIILAGSDFVLNGKRVTYAAK